MIRTQAKLIHFKQIFPFSKRLHDKLLSEHSQLEADHFSLDLQQQRYAGHPRVQGFGGGLGEEVGVRKSQARPESGGQPAAKLAAGKQGPSK